MKHFIGAPVFETLVIRLCLLFMTLFYRNKKLQTQHLS